MTTPWHALDGAAVLARLVSGPQGLSGNEAEDRLLRHGANLLPKPPPVPIWRIALRQLNNPLVWLLALAAAVSLAVGDADDAVFILLVIGVNAVIGAIQEVRAQRSAAALDHLVAPIVAVVRDGIAAERPAADLVPGDIVRLEAGMMVPADLRLLEVEGLAVEESALTGESLPVEKDPAPQPVETPLAERRALVLAGSVVVRGRASGVVVATAAQTEVGRLASALAERAPTPAPLVVMLEALTRRIAWAALALLPVTGLLLALNGQPLLTLFFTCVALAVAAIPEGLPIAITIVLAVAARRMAERQVIARDLPTVEGLGSCTMLVTDKTGTLTVNRLTVVSLWRHPEAMLPPDSAAAACCDATLADDGTATGDPVDVAILRAAHSVIEGKRIASIPYAPHLRFAAVALAQSQEADLPPLVVVKGALETVARFCDGDHAVWEEEATAMAACGQRVIAVAAGPGWLEGERVRAQLRPLGLIGIEDPLRADAAETVAAIQHLGVDVVMATGDHPATALAIAREAGIAERPDQVMTGTALARLTQAEMTTALADIRVFARVEPLQKLQVVEALQAAGHRVAVTGDGANDAPALEAADIGVAMGRSGTDVARNAADLILADDRLASLPAGIREGRTAFANLRKVVLFLLAVGLSEIVLFLGCLLVGLPAPLLAVQLLWLNLATNAVQHLALALDPANPRDDRNRPRHPGEPILDRALIGRILVMGAAIALSTGVMVAYWRLSGVSDDTLRSLVLTQMVLAQNLLVPSCRSDRRLTALSLAGNPFILLAIAASLGLHGAAMVVPGLSTVLGLTPPPLAEVPWMVLAAAAAVVPGEVAKLITRRTSKAQ
ncbi:MAG: cation-transporting P-type ATPase [Alphaproteobacteria bacterium]|nr:MAG: cation-transporting P-type ATPase [Alphaproteobacteria bacterium]